MRHSVRNRTMNRKSFSINPINIFLSLWRNWNLVWQMGKRDVIGRYRGSILGVFWSFVNPLVMLAVYTIVFGFIFPLRFGVENSVNLTEFSIILFAGLIIHSFFSECITRAPALIVSNVNYVKKVVFPLEMLPWVNMLAALFHLVMSVFVLLLCYLFSYQEIHWTVIFFPLLILPFMLMIMGISWFLAAFGVFVRDVGQAVGILSTALLFLSPVLYSLESVPEEYRTLFYLNPMTFIIEQTRNVLLQGLSPDWLGLLIYAFLGIVTAWLGLMFFQSTKKGFADVL